MGRRVRTGLFIAAAAGILPLLARAPGEPRPGVLGERAEVAAPESLRAGDPGRKGKPDARPLVAAERR
jgi:hypothetical protein